MHNNERTNMKKILFAMALALVMIACNKDNRSEATGEGAIALRANTQSEVTNTSGENITRLGKYLPRESDLRVKMEGENFLREWTSLEEFNDECENGLLFKSAPYTITLSSGDSEASGYGAAYFTGKAEVVVPDYGQTADVTVDVALGNSVVTIQTTDLFDGYFPQSKFFVKDVEYLKDGYELLFVKSGEVEILCEAVRQADLASGKVTTISKSVTLRPATHHILKFDLSTAGNISVEISFDDEVVEKVEIDVELNENA